MSSHRSATPLTPIKLPAGWDADPRPLEIDVGCHKGTFLSEMARLYPNRRFLGIERQIGRAAKTAKKLDAAGLNNACIIQGDARDLLANALAAKSVAVIHVSFPDPWPKRRHARHRLVTTDFLEAARQALAPDGVLRLMTDDQPYFEHMLAALEPINGFEAAAWDDGIERPHTEFEKKFLAIAKPTYQLALRSVQN